MEQTSEEGMVESMETPAGRSGPAGVVMSFQRLDQLALWGPVAVREQIKRRVQRPGRGQVVVFQPAHQEAFESAK